MHITLKKKTVNKARTLAAITLVFALFISFPLTFMPSHDTYIKMHAHAHANTQRTLGESIYKGPLPHYHTLAHIP